MTLETAEIAPRAGRLNNPKQNRGQDFHEQSWKKISCVYDNKHSVVSLISIPLRLFLPRPLRSSSLRPCFCIRVMSQGAARGLMYLHCLISFPNGRHGSLAARRNWACGTAEGWVGGWRALRAGDRPRQEAAQRSIE